MQTDGTVMEDLTLRGNGVNQTFTKIFIQRDYSEGTSIKFQSRFPQELEGKALGVKKAIEKIRHLCSENTRVKIEKTYFENAVNHINSLFAEADKMTCSRYCEGCIGCLSAFMLFFCIETHYEHMMKKVSKYVSEQNERTWVPRGLYITNPIERGLRVIEISLLNDTNSRNL